MHGYSYRVPVFEHFCMSHNKYAKQAKAIQRPKATIIVLNK
jgi:hypothetical protein